jgi:putative FmdB family regulatory protein
MPLYEFECPDCEHRFEELSKFETREEMCCPKCGSVEVVVLLSTSVASGLSSPGPGAYRRTEDPGFNREWDSIWADDPTAVQRSSLDED